jgi:hypothetical protein
MFQQTVPKEYSLGAYKRTRIPLTLPRHTGGGSISVSPVSLLLAEIKTLIRK